MNSWLDFGLCNPPSHGENRGSSPLGIANDFNILAPKWSLVRPASPTFLQWTVLQTISSRSRCDRRSEEAGSDLLAGAFEASGSVVTWRLASQALLLPNWVAGPAGLIGFGDAVLSEHRARGGTDGRDVRRPNIAAIWRGLPGFTGIY